MTNATDTSTDVSGSVDVLVAGVVDEFRARQKRGEKPAVEEYAARHPEVADLLRKVLATFQLLEASLAPSGDGMPTAEASLTGTLGDFRLLREVGRGGMGIVYEAEQISLGRRVALKVLPFAATLDPRQLLRFQNEARAAASLHHEHIVPVFAVGQERGIHYFAMQFIDGRSLAVVIKEQQIGVNSGAQGASDAPTTAFGEPLTKPADTEPIAGKSTEPSTRDAAYFRRVAQWCVQAAQGLEYAHSFGIVHRDIKPGNLMIDAQAHLWIADFGLARRAVDSDLTMTGDILGTLRYMSPEQAQAKHDLVDHRSDVYSLGATLYELLTLQSAVAGALRHDILHEVIHSDPKPPRSWERRIPADLETIVLKALAKEPDARYATAKEMAEDLKRFLEDRPILAKRPSVFKRLTHWSRRHLTAVASVFLFVGAIAGILAYTAVSSYLNDPQRVREDIERRLSRGENVVLIGESGPPGYFEWALGEERTLISSRTDRPFSVSTTRMALIAFPYAAQLKRYRLRVEVRHDVTAGLGAVGLFCSHRFHSRREGLVRSSWICLQYSDRGNATYPSKEKGGPDGRAVLHSDYLEEHPNRDFRPRAELKLSKPFFRAMPILEEAPWRQLEFEVAENSLRAFWSKTPGDREFIAEAGPELIELEEKTLSELGASVPKLKDVRMEYVPQGAFGLIVEQSTASIRRFEVQSLD